MTAGRATLGTFPVGTGVEQVAFDGANIWVPSPVDNNVTIVRASDGLRLAQYPVAGHPRRLAFDGTYMWIAGAGVGKKFRVSDFTSEPFAVSSNATAMAFDGRVVWIGLDSDGSPPPSN